MNMFGVGSDYKNWNSGQKHKNCCAVHPATLPNSGFSGVVTSEAR